MKRPNGALAVAAKNHAARPLKARIMDYDFPAGNGNVEIARMYWARS